MFELNRGAILPSVGFLIFHNSGHITIVSGQLLLLFLSFLLLVATLMRFHFNFKKCASAFRNAESLPHSS